MKKWVLFSGIALTGAIALSIVHYAPQETEKVAIPSTAPALPAPQEITAVQATDLRKAPQKPIAISREAAPLDEAAAKEFIAELETVFLTQATSSLNAEALRPHLMRLNERGERGVRTILGRLARPPSSDNEIPSRLAMVDYLRYRMRWDPALPTAAYEVAVTPIPVDAPKRYRAAAMADKAEIVNGLARVDWKLAAAAITGMPDPALKDLFAYEAFHGLLETGVAREEALQIVQGVAPKFTEEGRSSGRRVRG